MSDTPSSRPLEGPPPGGSSRGPGTNGPGEPGANRASPLAEDQPTVISKRPPLATAPVPKPATRARPSDIPPGARLGHFELLEFIGGGGMGRVFRAMDTRLGRTAALKVLSRDQAGDPETVMRFRNEARSAARLNHPGIAQVYYVGKDDGLPFIAFEFVEGINIRDLVGQRGRLPLAEALSYTLQVAEALTHAAYHSVVHRDIKPSNVLITPEGRAKLIDLGLARMERAGGSASDLTASGVTLGTFDYISPEQARDPRNADARSDLYSLGCTLFFMLTGRPPFPEGTVLQKLLQHQGIEPPDVRQSRPELPEEVSRVLWKMMAKEPRRRYQTATELIEALQLLAEQVGLRPLEPGGVAWAVPEEPGISLWQRHAPWIVPVAALLITVTSLQVLFWAPSGQEAEDLSTWVVEREAGIGEPTPSEQPRGSTEGSAKTDTPLRDSPKPAPSGLTPPELDDSESPSQNAIPAPSKPLPKSAADAGAEKAAPPAEASLEPDVPDPLTLPASPTRPNGLRPDASEGDVSPPERAASGSPVEPQTAQDGKAFPGPDGTSSESPGAAPAADASPDRGGLLIVDLAGRAEGTFATLAAACRAARDGDVIELRCEGQFEEEPMTLANLGITIRAGEGFRPTLRFRPSEIDPIKYPRSMFTLIGSQLTLIDLAVGLDIPREVLTDSWSLFEMGQGDRVRLDRCWLTVRNATGRRAAHHQDVTFFRLHPAPGTGVGIDEPPAEAADPADIQLADCVVRGEAVFVHDEGPLPAHLTWRNGLLMTTEQLLVAEGGEQSPHPTDAIWIELGDVTAVVDGGLCRLQHTELAPYQLPARIESATSVFVLAPKASLIEQVGVTDIDQSRQRIDWIGDRNLYEGFTDFWTVRHLDPTIPPEIDDLESWTAYWGAKERFPGFGLVGQSSFPGAGRPVHLLAPEDYTVTAVRDLPAEESGEASNVGFRVDRLPSLRTSPEEETRQDTPDLAPGERPPGTVSPESATPAGDSAGRFTEPKR